MPVSAASRVAREAICASSASISSRSAAKLAIGRDARPIGFLGRKRQLVVARLGALAPRHFAIEQLAQIGDDAMQHGGLGGARNAHGGSALKRRPSPRWWRSTRAIFASRAMMPSRNCVCCRASFSSSAAFLFLELMQPADIGAIGGADEMRQHMDVAEGFAQQHIVGLGMRQHRPIAARNVAGLARFLPTTA